MQESSTIKNMKNIMKLTILQEIDEYERKKKYANASKTFPISQIWKIATN